MASLPRPAHAFIIQPILPVIDSIKNTITWNEVADTSEAALAATSLSSITVTYIVTKLRGIDNGLFIVDPLAPLSGGVSTSTRTLFTSVAYSGRLTGSFCFVVQSSTPVSGIFNTSAITCHSFLHDLPAGNSNGLNRTDGAGTQLGFNQIWNMGYYLDADSYVTLKIYPPDETFTTDLATGFVSPTENKPAVATVIEGTPRSAERNAAPFFQNSDFWDSRNSLGATVGNGIYYAALNIYSSGLLGGTTQYANVFTIPVHIIRFTAFSTTGISPTVALANVNYSVTANANVRVVIAKPGRRFTIDGSGDVQALNAAGTAVDTSTDSVVQVIYGQRNAGVNVETWNGTDSLGVAVSTGVYAVGVSATDGSGNRALDLSGNGGPLAGSIALDRIPSQTAAGGTAPSVSSISVGGTGVNLTGGTSVGVFSAITVTLSATGGPATTITLVGPNGPIAGGSVNVSGTQATYSTTSVISTTGSYTVTVAPYDLSGVNPGQVRVTQFTLARTGPSVTAISIGGTSLSLGGSTSVGIFSSISITLSATGGPATSVTLTGPGGAIGGGLVGVSGTAVTYSTSAVLSDTGTYSISITAVDLSGNPGTVQNTLFNIPASGGGGGGGSGGSTQTNASFAATTLAFPNPVKTAPASISFKLAVASTVDIDIYTLAGRRVLHKTIAAAAGANGCDVALSCTFTWQLVNDAGSSIASGVYIARVAASNSLGTVHATKKILVVK